MIDLNKIPTIECSLKKMSIFRPSESKPYSIVSLKFLANMIKTNEELKKETEKVTTDKLYTHYTVSSSFVTPFGFISHLRGKIKPVINSNYTYIEIDSKNENNELDINELKQGIVKDNYVLLCFTNPDKTGLSIFVRHDESIKYNDAQERIVKYFESNYNMNVKYKEDYNEVCYLAYDPDVYFNENALTFNKADLPKTKEEIELQQIENCLSQIEYQEVDIFNDKETQWKLACAFAEYGKIGSKYFHRVSLYSSDIRYCEDATNEIFDNASLFQDTCREDLQKEYVSINYFFDICKKYDIDKDFFMDWKAK